VVEETYNVRKISSPSSSLLLLAKTITHPAARSLCYSWASCSLYYRNLHIERNYLFTIPNIFLLWLDTVVIDR